MSFDYHMNGDGTGSLELILKQERGSSQSVWVKRGSQGDVWKHADVDIRMSPVAFYQVRK